jgi:AcrR family transcriptional regulator
MPSPTLDLRETLTEEPVARMLEATMTCLARFGVAKTTIDDVAREAGCSRATVYRYFANRAALVLAAIDHEVGDLTGAVRGAGDDATTLEDAIVAMYVAAARWITGHEALQRALALEPEVILPELSFEGGDRLYAEATVRFAPLFARFLPPDRASRAAEWCTRVLLAYLHPDRAPLSMTDERAVRGLVRHHVIPAVSPQTTSPHEVVP